MGASSPQVADLDGDGIPDIVCSDYMCELLFFKGLGDGKFAARDTLNSASGGKLIIPNVDVNSGRIYGCVRLADWNNDGLLDLLFMSNSEPLQVFLNVGTKTNPLFGPSTIVPNGSDVFARGRPSFEYYDINCDGKKDLVFGGQAPISYSLNTGTAENPVFTGTVDALQSNGSKIEFTAADSAAPFHGESKLTVCDWNGDGYPDLLLGENCGWTVGGPTRYLMIMTGRPDGTVGTKSISPRINQTEMSSLTKGNDLFVNVAGASTGTVSLCRPDGRLVSKTELRNGSQARFSGIASGMYVAGFRSSDGRGSSMVVFKK